MAAVAVVVFEAGESSVAPTGTFLRRYEEVMHCIVTYRGATGSQLYRLCADVPATVSICMPVAMAGEQGGERVRLVLAAYGTRCMGSVRELGEQGEIAVLVELHGGADPAAWIVIRVGPIHASGDPFAA